MKNFIVVLIYLFSQFTYADFATTKKILAADVIQGTKSTENYIKDSPPKAANTKGWKCYADAAGVVPVDGTGGSPTVTFTASATTPLKNSGGGFIFTHLASNQQGMGCSYDFVIDPQDKAKILDVNLEYILRSGTFTAGGVSTDSDVEIYIYDITNATIVNSLSSNKLLSNSTTISDLFQASFQSASNSTSYRLILHSSTTTTSAFTLGFGDISVARSKYVYGTPITDWQVYTPTGTWVSNAIYTGSWRRVGDSAEIQANVQLTGAPNAANLAINIPSGLVMDLTKLKNTQTYNNLGSASILSAGNAYGAVEVGFSSSTSVSVWALSTSSASGHQYAFVTQANPNTFISGDFVFIKISVPIVGWSSSVQMSSDAPAGPVVMKVSASTAPTGSFTAASNTIFPATPSVDTVGGYNPATGLYTVKVSGFYRVTYSLRFNGTSTAATYSALYVSKNGSLADGVISAQQTASPSDKLTGFITTVIYANVSDTISITTDTNAASPSHGAFPLNSFFLIEKLTNGSSIARTEDTNLRYTSTAGQPLPTGVTILQYNTKDYDTGGSFTSNTTFTPKDPGKYFIRCRMGLIAPTTGLSNAQMNIRKNTTVISTNYTTNSYTATAIYDMSVQDVIQLNSGETADCTFSNNFGSSTNVYNGAGTNNIIVYRVGN